MTVSGGGNLFVDGKLAVELSKNPPLGEAFFGLGTIDARSVVKDLKKGRPYKLEVRLSNGTFISRGAPFFCRGGIRVGAARKVGAEVALNEAVELAKQSDVAVLVIGLNHELVLSILPLSHC